MPISLKTLLSACNSPHNNLIPNFYAFDVPSYSLLVTVWCLEKRLELGGSWQDFLCLYQAVFACRLSNLQTIRGYLDAYAPMPSALSVYRVIPFLPVPRGTRRILAPWRIWLKACSIAGEEAYAQTKVRGGGWSDYVLHFNTCYFFTSDFSSLRGKLL